ncbi:50S ribosomal protein L24 [Candidatus Micrarchaeota archaeon]|nr:50S ribosomal protein L24 [Candidatus Micrarchaeota archaeon]
MMKRDSERKKLYTAKKHEKRAYVHVHLSKELKSKLGIKKRAITINKGDSVKVLRGSLKGKSAKVARVSYGKSVVYLEGVSRKNAKGTETLIPFQPSNLILTELLISKERRTQYSIQAKPTPKVEAKPKTTDEKPVAKAPAKEVPKTSEAKSTATQTPKTEEKPKPEVKAAEPAVEKK